MSTASTLLDGFDQPSVNESILEASGPLTELLGNPSFQLVPGSRESLLAQMSASLGSAMDISLGGLIRTAWEKSGKLVETLDQSKKEPKGRSARPCACRPEN